MSNQDNLKLDELLIAYQGILVVIALALYGKKLLFNFIMIPGQKAFRRGACQKAFEYVQTLEKWSPMFRK